MASASRKLQERIANAREWSSVELDLSRPATDELLVEVPKSLRQLTNLRGLDLSGNLLTELPEWLGELTSLVSLDLSGNQLKKLPEWLGQLTRLHDLSLSDNPLALPAQ